MQRLIETLAILTILLALGFLFTRKHTEQLSEQERGELAARMIRLSAAVEEYLAGLKTEPTVRGRELLEQATAHDPSLLAEAFDPYLLRVQHQDQRAVLLLCCKDGHHALMEDAGCSAELDRQVLTEVPCRFTLRVSRDCRVTGEIAK